MQKITTFLWFDNNAEEAVNFYAAVFKDARIGAVTRCGDAGPGPKGSVLIITFQLFGQEFIAMNGGPHVKFNEGVSLFVNCETQAEIDGYWEKLSEGGEKSRCGWLKDKFGLWWQVAPTNIGELIDDADPKKAQRAMEAMMKMDKLDIAALKKAKETA